MIENEFQKACLLNELKPNIPRSIELDDRFVVVVLLDDKVYCIDDVCTHDGGTLGDGVVDEHCLVCPRHGAKFDVRTGAAITMPATEATLSHEVKVVDSMVYVKINEAR